MNTDELRRWLALRKREKELKTQIEETKEEADALESRLLDQFSTDGMDSVKLDGQTCYLHRQLWARPKNGDRAAGIAALRAAGMAEMVTENFNTNQVSALFREADGDEAAALPQAIQDAFEVTEEFSLRTRKAQS